MMKPLASCISQCNDRQPIIVCTGSTNSSEYRALNIKRALVRQYQIDGEVFTGNECKKCDWLVLNDDSKNAFFVELKGGHISDGIKQINNTVKLLMEELQNFQIFGRIIGKSTTHNVHSAEMNRWKENRYTKCGNNLVISKHSFEENI